MTVLAVVLLLQGCWLPALPVYVPPPTQAPIVLEEPSESEDPEPTAPPLPGQFTLRYVPAPFTMNPITARNRDNLLLTSLLYESLFILDENLVAEPLLCRRWHTEDYVNFTFEILPDISMHDGAVMTADDVVYSIRQASQSGRHASKLQSIDTITQDDELTITITLEHPNARFIRLLDIPIIRNGSIEERIPPGTGPYSFPYEDATRLTRFTDYRHFDDLPLTTIHLIECNDSDLTEFFDNGTISLLWDDPAGAFEIRINRPHEPRYYNTTALQYIGFNANSYVLKDPDVRRAIGCSIERQYIVDEIMNVPRSGQTVAAPIAISPMFDMYNTYWEFRTLDPLVEMAALLDRAGLVDADNDSYLEISDGFDHYIKFTLNFIVNIENAHKLTAARKIADDLRQFGFDINVRELQWGDFMDALEEGNFDMYYGETLLSADFDFSPLLLPGVDTLNFGGTGNNAYKPLIQNFVAARTPEEVYYTGDQLFGEITRHAPFAPILYKRYAIYSPMGVVTGATPGQSGVFYNFHDWSIDLYLLN